MFAVTILARYAFQNTEQYSVGWIKYFTYFPNSLVALIPIGLLVIAFFVMLYEASCTISYLRADPSHKSVQEMLEIIDYVIDAKYYNYGYSRNQKDLPQSSSITKQIGYNHYLSDHNDRKKHYSVFLLPTSLENEPIEYVGYAASEKEKNVIDKVAVCLIDLRTLVDVFYGTSRQGISREDLRQMLRHILSENFLNH